MRFFVYHPRTRSIMSLQDTSPLILLPSPHLAYHAQHGLFEASLIDWAAELGGGRTFVDAGAHTGSWTAMLAGKFNHVHAFEPHPETFRALAGTVALSNLTNVTLHNKALGHHAAESVPLHSTTEDRGSATLLGTASQSVPVDIITLDSLHLNDVGLMKIDVEGYEENVLRGGLRVVIGGWLALGLKR